MFQTLAPVVGKVADRVANDKRRIQNVPDWPLDPFQYPNLFMVAVFRVHLPRMPHP